HWADPASLDLLRFLARQTAAPPALLLATYRADELARRHPLYRLLPTLVREGRAARVDLRPLEDEAAVRALVAARYALAGAGEAALLDAVERATEAHLLAETPDGGLRFAHALIREALYQGLTLVRRRAWHRAVGEALVRERAPDPDAVAHHLRQAGDPRAA